MSGSLNLQETEVIARQKWEYAVLAVDMVAFENNQSTYRAQAWVGNKEIYNKTFATMYWSIPLTDFGREGWELVGTSSENALMRSRVVGWEHNETSRPVRMNFFFKRPAY